MPHMTAAFGFEFKIFIWAQRLVDRMANRMDAGFVLRFTSDGGVRLRVIPTDARLWARIRSRRSHPGRYILYDPFDMPEWAYLEWQNIEREQMERIIAAPFEEADFLVRTDVPQHRDIPGHSFPHTWNAVF